MVRAVTKLAGLLLLAELAACAGTSTEGGGAGNGDPFGLPGEEKPPPAQGAGAFTVQSMTPASAGKACPVGKSTVGIPEASATEMLDGDTYLHHITDGENAATVHCQVSGAATFSFAGVMQRGGSSLEIGNGMLAADRRGTANIKLSASGTLPSVLASSGACSIDASVGPGKNFQVKRGSMWASFSCASVEAAPSDDCSATGFFVLENCQE
jgi:hypothetical protein